MKMSELLEVLNNINNSCSSDPEVVFQTVQGRPAKLYAVKADGTCDLSVERGELAMMPKAVNTIGPVITVVASRF